MTEPDEPPTAPVPTRIIDPYGIDITDRIIAEFGSVESALAFADDIRRLLWTPELDTK